MKSKPRAIGLLLALLLLPAAGCTSPIQSGVNPVEQAGLRDTVKIEVLEFARWAPGNQPYVERLALTDAQVLEQLVEALDTGLRKGLKVQCIPEYTLRFHLQDGTVQEFGYSCGQVSFLRGEQGFWQGEDYRPPRSFDDLLQGQLALHPPEPVRAAINVVEEAGLEGATALEIIRVRTHRRTEGNTIVEQVSIESLRTVRDPETLSQLVADLDVALELVPRAQCRPEYSLRFTLADGSLYDLSYGCSAGGPAVLRGTQPFWREMDVLPPAEFNARIVTIVE
jgi:hypothetical protein